MNLTAAYVAAIDNVRREVAATRATVADVVCRRDPESLVSLVNDAVQAGIAQRRLRAGIRYGSDIARVLEGVGVTLADRTAYCLEFFGDTIQRSVVLLEVLAFGFDLDVGFWWRPGVVREMCGELQLDKDSLTTGPCERVLFTTEGVIVDGRYLAPYAHALTRFNLGLSGGFLDMITNADVREGRRNFGLLVCDDFVVDKQRHPGVYITKAYIYGPRGISVEKLRSPDFPKKTAGTVTMHMRTTDDDPESLMRTPLLRTEIEWSIQDGKKTVKIEELVPANDDGTALTRFVHAQWEAERELFDHFDGATLFYSRAAYEARLAVDLTKAEKSGKYTKVFRLDDVECDLWSQLVARFFYGNELVKEYLDNVG